MKKTMLAIFIVLSLGSVALVTPGQSGGGFAIERSTIAGGGSLGTGGSFTLSSSMGEAVSGMTTSGGGFDLAPGFWNVASTGYSISGAVVRPEGRGLTNAMVTLSGGPLLTPRQLSTTRLGAFQFANILPGYTFTVSVASRRFAFAQPSQTIAVTNNVYGILFTSTF